MGPQAKFDPPFTGCNNLLNEKLYALTNQATKAEFKLFFCICPPPGFLPVFGPLERYMTPTLDAALGRVLIWVELYYELATTSFDI